ncbi:hypothetical protein SAMN05444266_108330 [Chitinophaga jiangningensis]|uniref:Uncharacterized protein n=2 Tax=Chitinophaga jiangningensis TaxID=1419482 RepID=A0A1M7JE86_9BACT|nr:hypothetical protein SAMN05444266_108330 [Chitinophaga jiangningensis]
MFAFRREVYLTLLSATLTLLRYRFLSIFGDIHYYSMNDEIIKDLNQILGTLKTNSRSQYFHDILGVDYKDTDKLSYLKALRGKLLEDGYIIDTSSKAYNGAPDALITDKGIFFINDGGYKQMPVPQPSGSNSKDDTLVDRLLKKIKNNKIIAPIIVIGIGVTVLLAFYKQLSEVYREAFTSKTNSHDTSTIYTNNPSNQVDTFKLPIHGELPVSEEKKSILDGNVFLGRYYNMFLIGGVNLRQIKIRGRNKDGEALLLKLDTVLNRIKIDPYKGGYIEIAYKNHYYAINLKVDDWGEKFLYQVERINAPSMNLQEISFYEVGESVIK